MKRKKRLGSKPVTSNKYMTEVITESGTRISYWYHGSFKETVEFMKSVGSGYHIRVFRMDYTLTRVMTK